MLPTQPLSTLSASSDPTKHSETAAVRPDVERKGVVWTIRNGGASSPHELRSLTNPSTSFQLKPAEASRRSTSRCHIANTCVEYISLGASAGASDTSWPA